MVFVIDRHRKPLMPCTEKRARLLLERGRAVVHRIVPFTIRLKDRAVEESMLQPMRIKIDPGSKTTGIVVTLDGANGIHVPFLGEVVHKTTIKAKLLTRSVLRHGRRSRKTRYRPARFFNRTKPKGWLPPSLLARVNQTLHAIAKLRQRLPITAISVEHVKFDTQQMDRSDIQGTEYQQGTLQGYEVREYLLEKWNRACVYCGKTHVPLEIEHIVPKVRGGSHRISNLTLACHPCNQEKGKKTALEFGYPHIQAQAQKPLRDAAFMNATRWQLYTALNVLGLDLEGGSGARTKMQRIQHALPKEHYFDALCVGPSTPFQFGTISRYVQIWKYMGRGSRQMCHTNPYGFPIAHRSRIKNHFGFQTGDFVQAKVPKGKYAGTHTGRVSVRARGAFDLSAQGRRIAQGIAFKYCRILQRGDGWHYAQKLLSA